MSLDVRSNTEKAVYDPVEYLTPEIIRPVGIRDEVARGEVVEPKFRVHQPLRW